MSGGADGKGEGFFAGAFAERGEQLVLHPACHCSYWPDGALELLGIITRGAGIVGPGTVNVVFRKE